MHCQLFVSAWQILGHVLLDPSRSSNDIFIIFLNCILNVKLSTVCFRESGKAMDRSGAPHRSFGRMNFRLEIMDVSIK